MVEIARQQLGQPLGQPFGRLMRQAAEHDMRHDPKLPLDGVADRGISMAVASGPPGRDAVDQPPPILEDEPHPLGRRHLQGRRRRLHL